MKSVRYIGHLRMFHQDLPSLWVQHWSRTLRLFWLKLCRLIPHPAPDTWNVWQLGPSCSWCSLQKVHEIVGEWLNYARNLMNVQCLTFEFEYRNDLEFRHIAVQNCCANKVKLFGRWWWCNLAAAAAVKIASLSYFCVLKNYLICNYMLSAFTHVSKL